MHEPCSRLAQPLGDAHRQVHVRQASSTQVGQPVRRAVEFFGQFRPCQPALAAALVEYCVHLTQIPPQAAVRSCLRQPDIADVDNRADQEVLGRAADPSQDDQGVLAGHRVPLGGPDERSRAHRMIRELRVELRRLLREFVGQGDPVQPALGTLLVESGDERFSVERRQRLHAAKPNHDQVNPELLRNPVIEGNIARMFAESTMADLSSMLHAVTSLAEPADNSERIERIRLLEQLKGAVAAAQAHETAAFAAARRAEHAAARTKTEHVNRDIAGQVALARRMSPHQAGRYVAFASILISELPATYAALCQGDTTEWRALLVARHTIFLSREHRAEVDRLMGAQLASLGDKRVEAETRRHAYRLDPQGYVDRMRAAEKDRRVGLRPSPDAMVWLGGLLPVPVGVAAYAALGKYADEQRAAGDARTRGQLMADAFAERIMGCAADEIAIELELVMTDQTLFTPPADDANFAPDKPTAADEPAWLVGYGPLPAGYARSLVLDSPDGAPRWIRRLFTDPDTGQLAAMDSRRRLFTAAQRHFIRLRDQFCRTPWCEAPIRHADHVVRHERGGRTSVANGQGLCAACNQTKEASGWHSVVGTQGEVETITPSGRRYRSAPPGPPGVPARPSPSPIPRRMRSPVEWHFAALIQVATAAA
jgi:hypothetical protein